MDKFYTVEKHTQILIAIMKFHSVKKIVASPGTTNITLIGSLQNDPYFEIYSSVDERSAAYIACGLARESGEPVAISCTGATASRNYPSGLTEAFYSNLPILAITSTQHPGRVGQMMPQVLDRSVQMNDMVKKSILVDMVNNEEDIWAAEVSINNALLELRRHGGGPVHINLVTTYSPDFSARKLPNVRGMKRYFLDDELPPLLGKRIIIDVGTHIKWSQRLTCAVDHFCEKYNAAVICEHISNYRGKYGIYPSLAINQEDLTSSLFNVDVMIHIGGVLGFGGANGINAKEVWRVHPDGEVRDTFKKLTNVFEMQEVSFFEHYSLLNADSSINSTYFDEFSRLCDNVESKIPELPFSNPWIAQNTIKKLPNNCEVHLGILNSLRAWSLFRLNHEKKINIYSNTGGFGIDGFISTLLGSALTSPEKLFIGVVGDLAFFYDMNVLGNRHFSSNIRLMLINNGRGTEFRNFNHPAARFGEDADPYMAAAGHFGKQSRNLVKHYAEDLGFEYLTADSKDTYLKNVDRFLTPEITDRPMLFEVFTDSKDESEALKILYNIETSTKGTAKKLVKDMLGEKGTAALKGLLKK